MSIDWNAFSPGASLAGGVLLGLSATLLALANGRIAGVSGILGGLLRPSPGERGWRIAFLVGLLLAPLVYGLFAVVPSPRIEADTGTLILAGLLVGWGTRHATGCTSGHGVCGLSQRSPRSLVATLSFMAAGFATVFVIRHLLGGSA